MIQNLFVNGIQRYWEDYYIILPPNQFYNISEPIDVELKGSCYIVESTFHDVEVAIILKSTGRYYVIIEFSNFINCHNMDGSGGAISLEMYGELRITKSCALGCLAKYGCFSFNRNIGLIYYTYQISICNSRSNSASMIFYALGSSPSIFTCNISNNDLLQFPVLFFSTTDPEKYANFGHSSIINNQGNDGFVFISNSDVNHFSDTNIIKNYQQNNDLALFEFNTNDDPFFSRCVFLGNDPNQLWVKTTSENIELYDCHFDIYPKMNIIVDVSYIALPHYVSHQFTTMVQTHIQNAYCDAEFTGTITNNKIGPPNLYVNIIFICFLAFNFISCIIIFIRVTLSTKAPQISGEIIPDP